MNRNKTGLPGQLGDESPALQPYGESAGREMDSNAYDMYGRVQPQPQAHWAGQYSGQNAANNVNSQVRAASPLLEPNGFARMAERGDGRTNLTSNSNQKLTPTQPKEFAAPHKSPYYRSSNDLRLGAQGYSSCSPSELSMAESGPTRSGRDTYAGHLASHGDAASSVYNVVSSRISSKAYGMQNGNWMGMDASIQDQTLQDTTLGLPPPSSSLPPQNHHQPSSAAQPIQPYSSNRYENRGVPRPMGAFGDQSSICTDALNQYSILNQTQNKTLYQMTQTKGLDLSNSRDPISDYFLQAMSPRKDDPLTSLYQCPRMDSPNRKSQGGLQQSPKLYNLTLKIFYKTDYGESLQVVGGCEELGAWKSYTCPMKWTEGHIWVTDNLLIQSCSFFTYKYVVMFQNKASKWEKGPNRIADLEILPDRNKQNSFNHSRSLDSRHSGMKTHISQSNRGASMKSVQLKDEWEYFTLRFSIHSQFAGESGHDECQSDQKGHHTEDQSHMRIIGSISELTKGGSVGSGPLKMKRCRKKFRWLYDKYGQQMRPWECLLKLKLDKLEQKRDIIYSYSKSYQSKDFIYEREPSRIMEIQSPETYSGELGLQKSSQWKNWDKVWIVNGHIEKADANFLGELFFTKIGDTGISIGTHPSCELDVKRLQQASITGVLSLMNKNDHRQRSVNWHKLEGFCRQAGMKYARFAVNDIKEKELQSNLFIAAQHLHNLVNVEGLNVFVHCTSGLSRAPAVIIIYLCLYKKHKSWQNPDDVAHFVKAFNPKITPNMKIVNKCIQANLEFQAARVERILQKDQIEDSFYFPNMIIEESKHNPHLIEQSMIPGSIDHKSTAPRASLAPARTHKSELSPAKAFIPNEYVSSLDLDELLKGDSSASPKMNFQAQPRPRILSGVLSNINEANEHDQVSEQRAGELASTDQEALLLKQQVEREVAAKLEKIKVDQEAALESAMRQKLQRVQDLDLELQKKAKAIEDLETRRKQELDEMSARIAQEQKLLEQQREAQEDAEAENKRKLEAQKAENKRLQELQVEQLRQEMEQRLTLLMEERLRRQREEERLSKTAQEEQDARIMKLRTEAEEAAAESKRLQREIENKQKEHQQERYKKQQEEERSKHLEQLRIQREELEALRQVLANEQKESEERKRREESEARQKELEQREAMKSAADLQLELERERQKQQIFEMQKQMELQEKDMADRERARELKAQLEAERQIKVIAEYEVEQQRRQAKELVLKLQTTSEQKQLLASGNIETIPVIAKTPQGATATDVMAPIQSNSKEQTPEDDAVTIIGHQTELKEVPERCSRPSASSPENEEDIVEEQTLKKSSEAQPRQESNDPKERHRHVQILDEELKEKQRLDQEMKAKEARQRLALLQQRAEESAENLRLEAIKKKREEAARVKVEQEKEARARVEAEKLAEAERREENRKFSDKIKKCKQLESHNTANASAGEITAVECKQQQIQAQVQAFELAAAAVSGQYLVRAVEKMIGEIYEEQLDGEQTHHDVEQQRQLEHEEGKVKSEGTEREEEANRQGNPHSRRQKLATRKEVQRQRKQQELLAKQEAEKRALLGKAAATVDHQEQAEAARKLKRMEKPHELVLAANEDLAMDTKLHADERMEIHPESTTMGKRRVGLSRTTMSLQKVLVDEEKKTCTPERHMNFGFQQVQDAEGAVPGTSSFRTTESVTQERLEAAASFDFSRELSMFEPRRFEATAKEKDVHAARDSSDVNHPAQVIAEKYWHWHESPRPAPNTAARQTSAQRTGHTFVFSPHDGFQTPRFDQKCDEFFKDSPIKFKPRSGNKQEAQILKIIQKNHITIPVVHIKNSQYLVGQNRWILELKGDWVMVNAGGTLRKLEQFLVQNQKKEQRALCEYMVANAASLETVCAKLARGGKLKKLERTSSLQISSQSGPAWAQPAPEDDVVEVLEERQGGGEHGGTFPNQKSQTTISHKTIGLGASVEQAVSRSYNQVKKSNTIQYQAWKAPAARRSPKAATQRSMGSTSPVKRQSTASARVENLSRTRKGQAAGISPLKPARTTPNQPSPTRRPAQMPRAAVKSAAIDLFGLGAPTLSTSRAGSSKRLSAYSTISAATTTSPTRPARSSSTSQQTAFTSKATLSTKKPRRPAGQRREPNTSSQRALSPLGRKSTPSLRPAMK